MGLLQLKLSPKRILKQFSDFFCCFPPFGCFIFDFISNSRTFFHILIFCRQIFLKINIILHFILHKEKTHQRKKDVEMSKQRVAALLVKIQSTDL